MSQLFASGGQSIGVSASTSVLPVNSQDWSPLGWTGWISLQSKGLSRVFSSTTVQKHLVKAMVFPVIMYGCESWTIKKAESQRIDTFELWGCRRPFRVPWTARRSNQSMVKETSPGYSLEGLRLKLKLQDFGHLMWRTDSLKRLWGCERVKAGEEGDNWGWDDGMESPTRWTWVWASSGS